MTDDELIARADANYVDSWRMLVPAIDGGEVREGDGLLIVNSGLPVTMFNIAFVTRPLREPEAAIRRAAAYFDERRLPFIVRLRQGVDPAAERAAEVCGLLYSDSVPGMALRAIPPGGTAAPIEIRAVDSAETLAHHIDVVCASFGMPLDIGRRFMTPRVLDVPDVRLYVGYVDGKPVASSALIATHRVAGVYNVGCVEAYRRRGLGEAMTWHAVRDGAAMGCVMAGLQASEMGRPVYERMGFEHVAAYRTYVPRG